MKKIIIGILFLSFFALIWIGVALEASWILWIDEAGRNILADSIVGTSQTAFFRTVGRIGEVRFAIVIASIAAVILWFKDKLLSLWLFASIVFSGAIVTQTVKYVSTRPRPTYGLFTRDSWSFPSGHATGATIFYGVIIILAIWYLQKAWQRNLVIVCTVIFAILISWSRVYLGVHFTTDVIAGFFLGAGQLLIWTEIYLRIKNHLNTIKTT